MRARYQLVTRVQLVTGGGHVAPAAAPRIWVQERHGLAIRHIISPGRYRCQQLAGELADKWLEIAGELGPVADTLATAIRAFLRFTSTAWPDQAGELTLAAMRREHLDAWEAGQLAQQRRDRKDAPYQRVIDLFALLRRIGEDTPEALSPEVAARLLRGTRLEHIRRPAAPEFDQQERRLMLDAAGRLVTAARAGHAGPGPAVLVALHIQLALATGEPPEVLRALDAADVVVTGELSGGRRPREVAVTYTKKRSAERYQVIYTRRDRAALDAYAALAELTGPLRAHTLSTSLWLAGTAEHAGQASWFGPRYSLRTWVQHHVRDEDGNPAGVSEPVVFRRFRKTVTAQEALADPARYLRSRRRHSPRTFFEHYTASPVLRAEAGRILLEAIGEQFDAATSGPLVVTPGAEQLLAAGQPAPGLDPLTGKKLTAGELDTPVAACRDPLDSPHAPNGHPCPVFANGQCYQCPNALITRRHLPAALALAERIHPDHAPDPLLWAQRWQPVYQFLTTVVIPAFGEDDITAARQRAGQALLDGGLRNDIGGTDAAP
ncbi:MAG TPA: hypothetical protein VGI74_24395 [Streptosporangiaceae bacterium]|jgi:hypothetical protein